MAKSEKYAKMVDEVESIIDSLSDESLDLDEMVNKVEKGYALIQSMKEKLEATKLKITELHAEKKG